MKEASDKLKRLWSTSAKLAAKESAIRKERKKLKAELKAEFGRAKKVNLGNGRHVELKTVDVKEKFVKAYSFEKFAEVATVA